MKAPAAPARAPSSASRGRRRSGKAGGVHAAIDSTSRAAGCGSAPLHAAFNPRQAGRAVRGRCTVPRHATHDPAPPRLIALAWRQTLRDFRAGELRLLVVAVMLAVAALTAVGFFADRLEQRPGARRRASCSAAMRSSRSDQPAPPALRRAGRARWACDGATSASFPEHGPRARRRRAARRGWWPSRRSATPTRCAASCGCSAAPGARRGATSRGAPGARHGAGSTPALLDALQLKLGDTLLLGDAALQHRRRSIVIEPDRGAGFMSFAPRVMLQPGRPGRHRPGPAGQPRHLPPRAWPRRDGRDAACASFVAWAEAQIKAATLRGVRVESLESGRPEMRQTLDRAEKFLNLVALLAALAGGGGGGASRRATSPAPPRRLRHAARARPAAARASRCAYALEFGCVGLVASAGRRGARLRACTTSSSGCWPGWSTPRCRRRALWPALFGLGVGMTLLIGFGLPPVLQLAQRAAAARDPARRRRAASRPRCAVLAAGAAGFVALLLAVSQRPEARPDRGGRLCRGGRAVRAAVAGWR